MRSIYPEIPVPAVSTLVINGDKILAVLRGKPPSENIWSLPGGKIELGETILSASKREVFEETNVNVEPIMPFTAVDAIYLDDNRKIMFHYVIVYVMAKYIDGEVMARDDVIDARWFTIFELDTLNFEKKTLSIIKDLYNSRNPFFKLTFNS